MADVARSLTIFEDKIQHDRLYWILNCSQYYNVNHMIIYKLFQETEGRPNGASPHWKVFA